MMQANEGAQMLRQIKNDFRFCYRENQSKFRNLLIGFVAVCTFWITLIILLATN